MQLTFSLELFIALFVVFSLIIVWLIGKTVMLQKQQKQLETGMQASELAFGDLQVAQAQLEKQIGLLTAELQQKSNEDFQVSKQIEHRIRLVKQDVEQITLNIEQLKKQQPQDKLYSRANKLAALGADVEEIMTECELPRAEVEMLLSVYHQKNMP